MAFRGIFCVFLTVLITVNTQVNDKPDASPFQNLLTKELGRMTKTLRKQLHSEMTELVEEIRLKFLQISRDFENISVNTSLEIRENMLREKDALEDRFRKVVNYSNNRMEALTNYLAYLDLAVKGHADPYDLQNLLFSEAPIQNRHEREPDNSYATDHYHMDQDILYYDGGSSSIVDKSFSYFSTESSMDESSSSDLKEKMSTTSWKERPSTPRVAFESYATNPSVSFPDEDLSSSTDDLLELTTLADKVTFGSAGAMRPDDLTMIFDNSKPRSCNELYQLGNTHDGIYIIYPEGPGGIGLRVQCVMEEDEGGWTVILARLPDVQHEEFFRPLHDYIIGFGNPQGHYWMGLRHIESMSMHEPQELKIYLQDWDGTNATAEYDNFSISKINESWALHVNGYHELSTAGDALTSQNGAIFTYKPELGGWWHNEEGGATPTGKYYTQNLVRLGREAGVEWPSWKGNKVSLQSLVIMIRPRT